MMRGIRLTPSFEAASLSAPSRTSTCAESRRAAAASASICSPRAPSLSKRQAALLEAAVASSTRSTAVWAPSQLTSSLIPSSKDTEGW